MQRGFIQLSLMGYMTLAFGVIVLGLSIALKVQSSRLESCKAEHQLFVSQVERLGKEAKEKAKQVEAQDKLRFKKAEDEIKKLRSDNDKFKRLRDSDTRSRRLPEAPKDSVRPDLSCFDRTALESAYGELVKELRGLADEGTEATIGLDTAKRWIQSQ